MTEQIAYPEDDPRHHTARLRQMLRTHVHDGRGRRGMWFLSLDAARLPAVLAARVGCRLPYFW